MHMAWKMYASIYIFIFLDVGRRLCFKLRPHYIIYQCCKRTRVLLKGLIIPT